LAQIAREMEKARRLGSDGPLTFGQDFAIQAVAGKLALPSCRLRPVHPRRRIDWSMQASVDAAGRM